MPALDERLDIPAQQREQYIGTVDPTRSTAAQRAYLTAFFHQHLRGRPQHLLDGPSPSQTCASSNRRHGGGSGEVRGLRHVRRWPGSGRKRALRSDQRAE
ncbi:hypothetical protein AB0D24_35645 [Streptomyces javensis]|uniref:hypothetical protein n=1 Tax=Streptomyces javensis TaxID=114698 RepID=UPI0033D45765